jgi:hypothetical protein
MVMVEPVDKLDMFRRMLRLDKSSNGGQKYVQSGKKEEDSESFLTGYKKVTKV